MKADDLTEANVGALIARAQEEIAQGRFAFLNLAGKAGDDIATIALTALRESGAGFWETPDGGGDCFFATVDVMSALAATGADLAPWRIKTGRFFHPNNPVVTHAWLEHSGLQARTVLNVANLSVRPAYLIPARSYAKINSIGRIIQIIPAGDAADQLRQFSARRPGLDRGDLLREFTKRLLAPTLSPRDR